MPSNFSTNVSANIHLKKIETDGTSQENDFTKTWAIFGQDKEVSVNVLEDRVLLALIPSTLTIHIFDLFQLDRERRVINLAHLGIMTFLTFTSQRSSWNYLYGTCEQHECPETAFFDSSCLMGQVQNGGLQ